MVETTSRTVLSFKTCKQLKIIQLLDEIKEVTNNNADSSLKDQPIRTERADVEEKMRRIKGKYGEEPKEEVLKMYPTVFSALGKL